MTDFQPRCDTLKGRMRQFNTKHMIDKRNNCRVQLSQTINSQQLFASIQNARILDQNLLRCSWIGINHTLHIDKQAITFFA